MKRVVAIGLSLILLLSNVCALTSGDFEYSSSGVIEAYFGESFVEVPSVLDGTSITKIGEEAFFDSDIESITLNNGIIEIGDRAFQGAMLEYVFIPETVKKIGDYAFANCGRLGEVYIYTSTGEVEFGEDAFSGTGHINLYVYCSADLELLDQKMYAAKGNRDYDILPLHIQLADGGYDSGVVSIPVSVCYECGYFELHYPGELGHPFADVPVSSWYKEYVDAAYNAGIIGGKGNNKFDPDAGMTIAEGIKIAACIHALQNDKDPNPRGENWSAWYEPYVEYCYSEGIIEDYIFFEDYNRPITRGEMAYLFARCDGTNYYLNDVPITDIPDVYDTTPYAYEILELYNRGVAVGSGNYTYKPDDNIKRSEVSALVARILYFTMRIELPKG